MFPCTSCGLCCQNISHIEELKTFDLGNGICKHYNETLRTCNIYDDRPQICKVDEMFEIQYSNLFTKEAFYIENAKVCNTLQEQHKINKIFRVEIKD